MVTHLEPDILEYEVEGALGIFTKNKPSGGDGIPAELFQILKNDAVKILHSVCQQIWQTQQWKHRPGKGQFSFRSQTQAWKRSVFISIPNTGLEKVSFHFNPKERQCQRMFKLPDNCTHFAR